MSILPKPNTKLTVKQRQIVEILQANSLAWIGSDRRYKKCICLPPDTDSPYSSLKISDVTFDSMRKKGVLRHGALSTEQQEEFKRRLLVTANRLSLPSHGFHLTDEWKQATAVLDA